MQGLFNALFEEVTVGTFRFSFKCYFADAFPVRHCGSVGDRGLGGVQQVHPGAGRLFPLQVAAFSPLIVRWWCATSVTRGMSRTFLTI